MLIAQQLVSLAFICFSILALARPQRRDVLQVDGYGSPIEEVTSESMITITVVQTVTVPYNDSTPQTATITLDSFSVFQLTTLSSSIPVVYIDPTSALPSSSRSSSTPIEPMTSSLSIISNFTGSLTSTSTSTLSSSSSSLILTSSSLTLFSSISASSTPSSSSTVATYAPSPTTISTFLRGVNLGGWLVLEKWMDSDAFKGPFANITDQYTFDSIPGAEAALQTHWSTYFTEADVKTIAATRINALRIPIGFWAYDNTNTPYIKGADAFLEKAIGWAKNVNMKVWVDCHGSPGSQNGFDNSGRQGSVDWQQPENLARSISVLKTMAIKYGSLEYADTVVGLQLVNEPISWNGNVFSTSQQWAKDTYVAVKAAATNPNLVVVMHDAFETPLSWTDLVRSMNTNRQFGIDTHMYQLFTDADNALTQAQHITKACGWADDLSAANQVMPTFVGEWSAATNICVNPDGSTIAGTSCSTYGCQCQSADFSTWNDAMIQQVRRFVEAQLDVFETSASGYFIWAAKGPAGWGFLNGIQNGAIPNPITSRKYPGQCGSSRRAKGAALGATPDGF